MKFLCIFSLNLIIILSKFCSAADYQFEACAPQNCGGGGGPNISFPFFIPQLQKSYCGYPGFAINCRNETPFLQFSENEFIIREIFYQNRSLHVFNAAAAANETGNCPPKIRNTTLPAGKFDYFGGGNLRLFSGCRNVKEELLRYGAGCGNNGSFLAMYDGNGELMGEAFGTCEENVVARAELYGDEDEAVDVKEVLRRGFVMNWTASECNDCRESGGRCGFNKTSFHFRCFCADRPHSRSCLPTRNLRIRKIIFIGGIAIAALTSSFIFIYVFIRMKRTKAKQVHDRDIELFLKSNGNLAPMRYKFSTIKKMTKSFSETLGRGGFGCVYKGELPDDGHLVAVKVLNESNGNGEDFMNEVASISRTSHINIVALLGFCFEGSKRALIYDFMPNGSLEKFIGNNASTSQESKLGLDKLFEIALGIARGLEYLHQGCNTRILHLDIKPQNILLDKDLNPRISDFGLAKLCPNRSSIVSMMEAKGTIGYIAPEVFCRNFGKVSYKSDVYSYGMLVLEMVGGRRRIGPRDIDHSSEKYFPHYLYKQLEMNAERDGDIARTMNAGDEEGLLVKRNLIIVGLWCVQTNPNDRPTMAKVVEMLEGKLGSLEAPPKPQLYSPPAAAPSFSISESL